MVGLMDRRIGSMKCNVFIDENIPVDIQKISPPQRRTGNQYFVNVPAVID